MKKIFGELNLSWKTIIISAIVIGIVVGLLNSVTVLLNTSITDPAIYFDLWILFGILIIMNSKSNKEAALKSFVFFCEYRLIEVFLLFHRRFFLSLVY